MNDNFISVKEAAKLAGKSETTIKRLIREVTSDPEHEQRSNVLPSCSDLVLFRETNKQYKWRLAKSLVTASFSDRKPADSSNESVIELLKRQLESKDTQLAAMEKQLDRKDTQIENLNEHLKASSQLMHESNVLLGSFQKRLGPPESNDRTEIDSTATRVKQGMVARIFGRKVKSPTS